MCCSCQKGQLKGECSKRMCWSRPKVKMQILDTRPLLSLLACLQRICFAWPCRRACHGGKSCSPPLIVPLLFPTCSRMTSSSSCSPSQPLQSKDARRACPRLCSLSHRASAREGIVGDPWKPEEVNVESWLSDPNCLESLANEMSFARTHDLRVTESLWTRPS